MASRILSPELAVRRAREAAAAGPRLWVIGIAGPGDPLANPETMAALRLAQRELPQFTNLTVTVNAQDPRVESKILPLGPLPRRHRY